MAKILRCNDLFPGCPYEAHGANDEEVLSQGAEHAVSAQHVPEITPELLARIRNAIRDAPFA